MEYAWRSETSTSGAQIDLLTFVSEDGAVAFRNATAPYAAGMAGFMQFCRHLSAGRFIFCIVWPDNPRQSSRMPPHPQEAPFR